MKTREIVLSATLISLYVATQILGSVTAINLSSLMLSALFGLFWHYFSTKQNLAFQGLRFAYNGISAFRSIPKFISYLRVQSVGGLAVLDYWFSRLPATVTDQEGYRLLEITGQAQPTSYFYLIFFGYMMAHFMIVPYLFYRYFRWRGIFNRLPSF